MPLNTIFNTTIDEYNARLLKTFPIVQDITTGRVPIILHPAGRLAAKAAKWLSEQGADVRGFSDNDPMKHGQTCLDLPILNPCNINNVAAGAYVLVASSLFDSVICEHLQTTGQRNIVPYPVLAHFFPDAFANREYRDIMKATMNANSSELACHLYDILADEESRRVLLNKLTYHLTFDKSLLDSSRSTRQIYFDEDIVSPRPDEVVADCGAYIGDTLAQFAKCRTGVFDHYHAFEPGAQSFVRLTAVAREHGTKVSCVQSGVHKNTGQLYMLLSDAGVDCAIIGQHVPGAVPVNVTGLDEYFRERRAPTIIKMDIEGSEADALRGASNVIATYRPRLAVSAYHTPSDLWEIPLLMQEQSRNSRIYLRHYTREIDDTVCYAIPNGD